jgi:Lrp/AsnC family leucine-responsive transcriptional regulator
MMATDPDERDRKILSELQKDSDRTNKEIADIVGVSAAAFGARKDRLKRERYIKKIHAVLEPSSFELHWTGFVLVSLLTKGPEADKKFAEVVMSKPNVLDVHSTFGQYDAIIKLRARSNEELFKTVEEIAREGGAETETLVVARTSHETTDIDIVPQTRK